MKQKRWEPELLLLNRNLRTMHDDIPRGQAVAINRERIMAVGDNDAIGKLDSCPNV